MRDYGKVSSQFWTGKTGKSLRGDAEAQLLALYLMTSPHSNMIGVYHCPIMYMAYETGMTIEGASKALQSLIEAGFCTFDEDDEVVWVHALLAHQTGCGLSPKDNRVKSVQKQFAGISQHLIKQGFFEKYKKDFYLGDWPENTSPLQAPSKPLASQKQKQKQKQKQNNTPLPPTGGSVAGEQADACQTESETIAETEPENATPTVAEPKFSLPAEIPKDLWQGFEESRKKRKKPMTDRARRMALATLQDLAGKGHDVKAVMEQSILHAWDTFYPLKTAVEKFAAPPGIESAKPKDDAYWAFALAK